MATTNCCNWPNGHAADAHELSRLAESCSRYKNSRSYMAGMSQMSPSRFTAMCMAAGAAKTGLRIPRTDVRIVTGIGTRMKYIPMSLVSVSEYKVRCGITWYTLRMSPACVALCLTCTERESERGQTLCTNAIMRLQDIKLVCLFACVYLCVCGDFFGAGDCPNKKNGAWMVWGKTQCLLLASFRDADAVFIVAQIVVKNNDD